MIGRLLALATISCLAGSALADTIGVRSGEHPTFTRLVFSIPEGTEWRLGRAGEGYGLRFGSEAEVSAAGVFRRIDRNRLADLRPVPGGVDLALACECHADAFLYGPGALVVDIVDGAPERGSEFEAALASGPARPMARVPQPGSTLLPIVLPGQFPPGVTGPDIGFRNLAGSAAVPVVPEAGRDSPEALAEAEARLLESLAGAAAAGLLVLDPSVRRDDAEPAAPMPVPEPPPSEPQGPGIAARTGLGTRTPGQAAAAAPFCPPEDQFEVAAWVDPDETFEAELARRRLGLTDESGTPTPDGALALARFYVAMGLGREALVTLELAEAERSARDPLAAMARLLDDRPDGASFPVAMPGCPGPAHLWSILIRGTTVGVAAEDIAAAQTAFMLLPEGLGGLIGPRFSRILTENGHELAADTIVSDLRRTHGVARPEAALAEADVALSLGGPAAAVESLKETAADPGRLSPESVVQLIELSLRGGIPVAEETLTLAATLRYEQRNTPAAGDLARAEIRARIAGDEFAEALRLIDETVADLEPESLPDTLRAEALTAFARRSGDDAFLDAAFRPLPEGAPMPVRDLYADRLESLGFPERADEIRSGADERGITAPPEAIPQTPQPSGAEPEPVDHQADAPEPAPAQIAAQETTVETPDPAPAAEPLAAWRSGEWSALQGGTDQLLSNAATAALAAQGQPDGPPLAAREQLLDETAATRSMIEELLNRFPSPEQPAD